MQTYFIVLKFMVVIDDIRSADMFSPPLEADGKDPGSAVVVFFPIVFEMFSLWRT